MITKLKDFFKIETDYSMARLITFICAISAALLSIGAIPLAFRDSLSYDYVILCIGLWGTAYGGKNWAKSVELKKGSNNVQK